MDDDLLDSALQEFEEEKEPKPHENKTENIQEILEEIAHDIEEEPGVMEDVEKMINNLANELENNQDLKEQIEQLGNDFFQEGVLKSSMEELRDKLKEYLSHNNNLPQNDLERYQTQLLLYNQICDRINEDREEDAMKLISELSHYGELPKEILPPMPEDCSII